MFCKTSRQRQSCMKKKQKKWRASKNPKTKKFAQKSKTESASEPFHLHDFGFQNWLKMFEKISLGPRLEGDGHDSVSAPVAESHLNRCQSSLQKHGRKIVGLEDPATDPGGSWPPLKRFKKGTFRRVFDFVAVDLG